MHAPLSYTTAQHLRDAFFVYHIKSDDGAVRSGEGDDGSGSGGGSGRGGGGDGDEGNGGGFRFLCAVAS